MPKLTLTGHPLHPQIVSGPLGLLPTALAFDALYFATKDKRYADASYLSLLAAEAYGVAAAVAGFADYLTLPGRSPAKRTGTLHGVLNAAVLGLTAAATFRRKQRRPDLSTFALNAAANLVLTFSAWYGGELVYKHGVRVSGREDLPGATELKLPFDSRLEAPFIRIERAATKLLPGRPRVQRQPGA